MNTKELLEAAWRLIEDPVNRCTGCFALDDNREPVVSSSPEAVYFCAVGALNAVDARYNSPDPLENGQSDTYHYALGLMKQATVKINNDISGDEIEIDSIASLNDSDVVNNPPKIYKLAIELASKG